MARWPTDVSFAFARGASIAGDARSQREGLAQPHTALTVNEETVVLDVQIVLQRTLGAQKMLKGIFRLAQFRFQSVNRLLDFENFFHQSAK